MTAAVLDLQEYAETVRPEWTAAGHLSVSHFLLLFDHASDAFRDSIGLGRAYVEDNLRGLVVAEAHLTYGREVLEGERIRIRTRLLGVAPRKLHIFHEMRREQEEAVVATAELILVHVDRANGCAVGLPSEAYARAHALACQHTALPPPPKVGRAIQLELRR